MWKPCSTLAYHPTKSLKRAIRRRIFCTNWMTHHVSHPLPDIALARSPVQSRVYNKCTALEKSTDVSYSTDTTKFSPWCKQATRALEAKLLRMYYHICNVYIYIYEYHTCILYWMLYHFISSLVTSKHTRLPQRHGGGKAEGKWIINKFR